MNDYLTTAQAAEELGVTAARVRQLILSGSLPAKKIGRDWAIERDDLELVRERKLGRPFQKKE